MHCSLQAREIEPIIYFKYACAYLGSGKLLYIGRTETEWFLVGLMHTIKL